ncbi:unnamed protein product [Clonostachys rosea f. rosea IK726]|uniref:Uncharacterized protein n=1 Tax=Clonostachys rosea f. rosea IK726 TaxID=1349383 RepID=A0ACA9TRT1_BIOOC|nr:unnamed protein product [Clonostachys rosea f. rosea IK726]
MEGAETLEQMQARHRKELRDLQGKVTSKKKNATKKTRKGVNDDEYMKKTFEASGLVEKEIAPDGHCLFSAVADQLRQNDVSLGEGEGEPEYKAVRRAASSYMVENADDFAPFLEEDLEPYAAKMRDTAEWGGQLELMALARRYGVEIRVIQDGRTEKIGEEEGKASGKTIWLAYYRHGYGLGEHYNSLRKTT